jgi:hypothetical protein
VAFPGLRHPFLGVRSVAARAEPQPRPATIFQDAAGIPRQGLREQGGDATFAANERMLPRRQPMAQVEILRQILIQVRPLQAQPRPVHLAA